MVYDKVSENAFGTIGTICWTIQFLPQLWKSWRLKSTDGLSPLLPLTWAITVVPMGSYCIIRNLNIPLIVQPHVFSFLSIISWVQCQRYSNQRSHRWCWLAFVTICIVLAAIEVWIVFLIQPMYNRRNPGAERGTDFLGVLSIIVMSIGLLPQYFEIYRLKAVVGISVAFIFIDMAGGVFNDLSLAFRGDFDVLAAVNYSLVIFMDALVLLAAVILNPRARKRAAGRRDAEVATIDRTIRGSFRSSRWRTHSALDSQWAAGYTHRGFSKEANLAAPWPAHVRDEKFWRFEDVSLSSVSEYSQESCADSRWCLVSVSADKLDVWNKPCK